MAGIAEKVSLDQSSRKVVKIVLKRCTRRTEKAVQELLVQNGDSNDHHPCHVCGSTVDKCNSAENSKEMSPVQLDLFKNLILVTLESSRGGGYSLRSPQEEDVQNYGCEECLGKFVMLESLQNEIALLENKVEEILSQLRKTISDHRGLIPEPNLTVHDTKPVLDVTNHSCSPSSGMEEDMQENPFTTIITAESYDDQEIDLKPVILNFKDELLTDDEDGGSTDDPFGGFNPISKEQYMNNADQGDHNQPRPNKSRRCKIRATQVIADILDKDDDFDGDANGDDAYSHKNESDTDSDNMNELELDSDSRHKVKKGATIPSHQSSKEDEKDMKIHGSNKKRFPCETCHQTFSTQKILSAHNKRVHLQQLHHKCHKCGKGFYIPSDLKRHLNMRFPCTTLPKDKKFICHICKRGFSTKSLLRNHTRAVHNGEKLIYCPHSKCKRSFFDKTYLQRHLELPHPQKKGISCTICNQEFSTVLQQLDHIRSSHTCKFCNNSFPKKADLDKHKATHHTGEKPYLCNKCGNNFSRADTLRRHLRITICNPDENEVERLKKRRQKYKSKFLARKKLQLQV